MGFFNGLSALAIVYRDLFIHVRLLINMSKLYYCHCLNRLLVTFTADLVKTVKNVFIITQVIIEIRVL